MATFDRELFDWMIANGGGYFIPITAANGNLSRGPFPTEEPDNAAALIYHGGLTEAPDRAAFPRFQVLIRGASQDEALAILTQVRALLASNYGWTMGSTDVYYILEESGGFIGYDDRQRFLYSANYRLGTSKLL